ncbi:unnamed protein product [Cylindrotheca closterium]|uniref:HSF-type DNA-binding domain-containing protein n=1 Tax=Cylindrotheca closterium TaxID=2856 RepID=A0AAD2PWC1_9STRA|nr:unnamed protein product [Cylindrotheca closterium]
MMKEFPCGQMPSPRVSMENYRQPFDPAIFSFPQQLFLLLQIAENSHQEDTISWAQDGKSFTVHDPNEFEKKMLVKYFQMKKYASFTRQLCAYGFSCVRQGRKPGRYYHPIFARDDYNACNSITRGSGKAYLKQSFTYTGDRPSSIVRMENGNFPSTNFSLMEDHSYNFKMGNLTPASYFLQPISAPSGTMRAVQELKHKREREKTIHACYARERAMSELSDDDEASNPVAKSPSFSPSRYGLNPSARHSDHHGQKYGSHHVRSQILPNENESCRASPQTRHHEGSSDDASSSSSLEPRTIQDMIEEPELYWAKRKKGS